MSVVPATMSVVYDSLHDEVASIDNEINQNNTQIVGSLFSKDLSKKKFEQAKQHVEEIGQENVNSVGALFNKDLGRQKLMEAKNLEHDISNSSVEAMTGLFTVNLASSKLKEADNIEIESNESKVLFEYLDIGNVLSLQLL